MDPVLASYQSAVAQFPQSNGAVSFAKKKTVRTYVLYSVSCLGAHGVRVVSEVSRLICRIIGFSKLFSKECCRPPSAGLPVLLFYADTTQQKPFDVSENIDIVSYRIVSGLIVVII